MVHTRNPDYLLFLFCNEVGPVPTEKREAEKSEVQRTFSIGQIEQRSIAIVNNPNALDIAERVDSRRMRRTFTRSNFELSYRGAHSLDVIFERCAQCHLFIQKTKKKVELFETQTKVSVSCSTKFKIQSVSDSCLSFHLVFVCKVSSLN